MFDAGLHNEPNFGQDVLASILLQLLICRFMCCGQSSLNNSYAPNRIFELSPSSIYSCLPLDNAVMLYPLYRSLHFFSFVYIALNFGLFLCNSQVKRRVCHKWQPIKTFLHDCVSQTKVHDWYFKMHSSECFIKKKSKQKGNQKCSLVL